MDFLQYIEDNTYVMVPVLFLIGMALKSTPKIPNWLIPYVLGATGILLCIGLVGLNATAVVQGLLAAGASVYADQLGKQASEHKN